VPQNFPPGWQDCVRARTCPLVHAHKMPSVNGFKCPARGAGRSKSTFSPRGDTSEWPNRFRGLGLFAGMVAGLLRGQTRKHPCLDRRRGSQRYAQCAARSQGKPAGMVRIVAPCIRQRLISWKAHYRKQDAHPDFAKEVCRQQRHDRRDGSR